MKKFIVCFLSFLFLFPFSTFALSDDYDDLIYGITGEFIEEEIVNIYFFYGDGCEHCAKEEKFLDQIIKKYENNVRIFRYETWYDDHNKNLMLSVKKLLGKNENISVPFTVIGKESYSGYNDYVGEKMENQLRKYLELDIDNSNIVDENKEEIPLLGRVDVKEVSILLIAIILGLVDGFNPCAMWILLFLINMLFGMENKKRMLFLGISFLFVSSLVYFLSMLGLTTIFSMISMPVIRSLIGVVAVIIGFYNLKKYLNIKKSDNEGCHVVDSTKRKKIFNRIRKFTTEKNLWLAFFGVVALAISVNLVELACSTVFPATFAEILAINDVTGFSRILYLLVYTLFYMIDDMVVFVIAVCTLSIATASSKYGKYSSLIGGIIMLIVGLLLIFKPEWIMFNF